MTQEAKRSLVEQWLKANRSVLKIKALEEKLKFPLGTIQKFVTNERGLKKERIQILYDFIHKEICKK